MYTLISVWEVSLCVWYSFSNLLYVNLNTDQDPSQLEKHSLLHCHSLWRCGGVGLRLENVQEHLSCI